MEAVLLRTPHPAPAAKPAPTPRADDYGWVYDDPDLAPFRPGAARRGRKETPLTAFL